MHKKLLLLMLGLMGCGGRADGDAQNHCSSSCGGQSNSNSYATCGGARANCAVAASGASTSVASARGGVGNTPSSPTNNTANGGAPNCCVPVALGGASFATGVGGATTGGGVGTGGVGTGGAGTRIGVGGVGNGGASLIGIGGHAVGGTSAASGGLSARAGSTSVTGGTTSAASGGANNAQAGAAGRPTSGAGASGAGTAGHNGIGTAGSGNVRSYSPRRAACGSSDCDAWSDPSGFANCCYASETDNGCGNSNASGCSSFPASLLHCDSGGDCSAGTSTLDRLCVFEVGGRRAFCGGAVPNGTTQIQLCQPGEACTVGSCQATTLEGRLPPQYWACLP
ncbi:MAG TPA: hypothetical protein VIV60_02260 [Polyangiaceae bacterium]